MPRLVAGPPQHAAPSTYKLAPSEAFIPESVTATFDGTGAGGTFLPTLSIYSQDGKLIARSPATQLTAGDSAEVTFAPLLRAAQGAASPGVAFANWVSVTGTVTVGGALYQHLDGQYFETTDTDVFEMGPSEDVGVNGLTKVMLIKEPGTYTTVAFAAFFVNLPAPDEPAASVMTCTWDSFFYPATELDTAKWRDLSVTGKAATPFGSRNVWTPWASDSILLEASDLPPINTAPMEYVPGLYNAGTQTMNVISYMWSVRWTTDPMTFF